MMTYASFLLDCRAPAAGGSAVTEMSDNVQEIMAAAFAAVRDDLPKFEDIEAEPTFADDTWSAHTRGRAAAATVEALVYGLRDGIEKLNHDRLRRLSELN